MLLTGHYMPVMLGSTEIRGYERDKYLLLSSSELRVGATQQPVKAKSTREPAR